MKPENDSKTVRRIMACIVVFACLLAQLGSIYLVRSKVQQGFPDFINFYTAGKIVATGNGTRLYDLALQEQTEGKFSLRSNAAGFLPFVHPPFFALGMVIPAMIPYPAAYYVWWGCNQCAFWLALLILDWAMGGSTLRPGRLACAALIYFPVTVAFLQGQDSLLILFWFSLMYLFRGSGRPTLAGAALGMAAFKPQLALSMFLLLVLTSRDKWRISAGFFFSCLGQMALATAVLGWRVVVSYPKFLAGFASGFDEGRFNVNTMPNLRGLLHVLAGKQLPGVTLTRASVMLTALLLMAAVYVLISRNAWTQPDELRYALATATAFLAGYYGFFHDMTLLLLPLLIVWNWLAKTGVGTWRRRWLAAGVAAPFASVVGAVVAPNWLGPIFACAGCFFWGTLLWNLRATEQAGLGNISARSGLTYTPAVS